MHPRRDLLAYNQNIASHYSMVRADQQYDEPSRNSQHKLTPSIVSATIIICIALLYLTPNKQPASWVFAHFTDGSGWGSKVFSFFLGFLSVAWTMTDYDGTTQ